MEIKEQENKIEAANQIETALEKVNVTRQVIAKLKADYTGLKIDGIEDKVGLVKIEAAFKEIMRLRTETVRVCKREREASNAYSKMVIAKETEVVNELLEIETPLREEKKRIEAEKEQILFEAAQKLKLPQRKEKLASIGVEVPDEVLLKHDDNAFYALFNDLYEKELAKKQEALKAEQDRIAAEEAEKERLRLIEVEKENERLRKEREEAAKALAEVQRKAKEEADKQAAIKQAQLDAADKLLEEQRRKAKAEADKAKELADKEAARIKALNDKKLAEEKAKTEAIAKELKEKKDAEMLAQAKKDAEEKQRIEAEKKAALAPEKTKLKNWVASIVIPEFNTAGMSAESIAIHAAVSERFKGFKEWADKQVN